MDFTCKKLYVTLTILCIHLVFHPVCDIMWIYCSVYISWRGDTIDRSRVKLPLLYHIALKLYGILMSFHTLKTLESNNKNFILNGVFMADSGSVIDSVDVSRFFLILPIRERLLDLQ